MTSSIQWEFGPSNSRMHRVVVYVMLGTVSVLLTTPTILLVLVASWNVPRRYVAVPGLSVVALGVAVLWFSYRSERIRSTVRERWPFAVHSLPLLVLSSAVCTLAFQAIAIMISFNVALGLLIGIYMLSGLFTGMFASRGEIDFEQGTVRVVNQSAEFGEIDAVRVVNLGLFSVVWLTPRIKSGSPFPRYFAARSDTAARIASKLRRRL